MKAKLLNFIPDPRSNLTEYDQSKIYGRISELELEVNGLQFLLVLFIIIAGISLLLMWYYVSKKKGEKD